MTEKHQLSWKQFHTKCIESFNWEILPFQQTQVSNSILALTFGPGWNVTYPEKWSAPWAWYGCMMVEVSGCDGSQTVRHMTLTTWRLIAQTCTDWHQCDL